MKDLFLSPYGLCILGAAGISTVVGFFVFSKCKLPWFGMAILSVLTVLIGYPGARIYYIAAHHLATPGYIGVFFSSEPYHYAFCGAVIGFMIATLLTGVIIRKPVSRVADAAVIPGLVMIILSRAAEVTTDFGWGPVMNDTGKICFPFAVQDQLWGDWHLATFFLEALLAAAALIIVIIRRRKIDKASFATGLLWWCMGQILSETLRVETIKYGFIPLQQVQCAVFGLIVLIWYGLKTKRSGGKYPAWYTLAYLAGVGLVAFFEWAMDKCTWPSWIDYSGMFIDLIAMGMIIQTVIDRYEKREVIQ